MAPLLSLVLIYLNKFLSCSSIPIFLYLQSKPIKDLNHYIFPMYLPTVRVKIISPQKLEMQGYEMEEVTVRAKEMVIRKFRIILQILNHYITIG